MHAFTRLLHRRLAGEGGFAMVTVVLAILVVSILGTTVVQQSLQTTSASAYDRARTQAIHAAEAGLDQAMAVFETASTSSLPCLMSGSLTATPPATWSVTIDYYATYPPSGSPMQCSGDYFAGSASPAGAALRSTGSVTGWQPGTIERHMESAVSFSPVRGRFNKAIFSDETPAITSNITIHGENGNDADFLTNSAWVCQNSLTVYGSIYVQGTATFNNSCRTAVDLWARDSITMSSSSRVDHNAKSSTGSLTMSNNSSVGNNAQVAGTCTGCAGRLGGTLTTGYAQSNPPTSEFPTIAFDAAAWQDEGYAVVAFTDCNLARNWITSSTNSATKAVIRITGGCSLTFSGNTTVTRTADLGIFTDGEIITQNNTTFTSGDSSWYNLFLIVETTASCSGSDGRITMSNQTGFTRMYFFVYSPCYSSFGQNNSSARGQIYGKVVGVANNLTYTFHAMLVPGAGDITGYDPKIQYIREVD